METAVPAIGRLSKILDVITEATQPVTALDIVEQTSLPQSTVYRLLGSLVGVGFLETTGRGKAYVIGARLRRLARAGNSHLDLPQVVKPFIDDLAERLVLTVKVSRVVEGEVEVIQFSAPRTKYKISVDIGERFPLHGGAASKVLLAFLPAAIREAYLRSNLESFTSNTLTNPMRLAETLTQIRRDRVAYDNEEVEEGIMAVAFPILNAGHDVVGALSVPFIVRTSGAREELDRIAAAAKNTALEISGELGAAVEEGSYPVHMGVTV